VAAAGDEAAAYFYGRLFAAAPALRALFPASMSAQRGRILHAFARIAPGGEDEPGLDEYLAQLGRSHRKHGVRPAHYGPVGEALLATVRAFAGPDWTPAWEAAWESAYGRASAVMIRAAREDARLAPAWWDGTVVSHELRRPGLAVITVRPEPAMPYLAGQHVAIQTPRWRGAWRPYSIAGAPEESGLLRFHVREIAGGWVSTALVRHTAPGGYLRLARPAGAMTLASESRDLLCVAGGTGLAPIKAIIEQAVLASPPRRGPRIWLFHGATTADGLYDLTSLWSLAQASPQLQIIPVVSQDRAFDGLRGLLPDVLAAGLPTTDCDAYVAGPPGMVRKTLRVLQGGGIGADRIHYDAEPSPHHRHASAIPPPPEVASRRAGATTQ
jgi:NAD(P)H-flavin reductase/hemoglobin-like flavoprotein